MPKIEDIREEDLNSKYREIVRFIGLEATLKLGKEFGGDQFYLPKLNESGGARTRARDRKIIEDLKTYSGSIVSLARKHKVTPQEVSDLIGSHDTGQKENSVSLKYKKIAQLIGLEATLKLSKEFGSEAFYLPKLDAHGGALSRVRNRMIVNDLGTHFGPVAPLARKYGVSSRHIYDLIEKRRTDKK